MVASCHHHPIFANGVETADIQNEMGVLIHRDDARKAATFPAPRGLLPTLGRRRRPRRPANFKSENSGFQSQLSPPIPSADAPARRSHIT